MSEVTAKMVYSFAPAAEQAQESPSYDSYDMGELKTAVEDWRDEIFPYLDSCPESPTLKVIKRDANDFIGKLWSRRRDFGIASVQFIRLQTIFTGYIINTPRPKIRTSKAKAPDGTLELEEIEPSNERERRAMVLLKVLKLHPDKALSTARCKELLEASEGMALTVASVKRAMEFLEIRYSPLIVIKKIGKNCRIRTNFSTKGKDQGDLKDHDSSS